MNYSGQAMVHVCKTLNSRDLYVVYIIVCQQNWQCTDTAVFSSCQQTRSYREGGKVAVSWLKIANPNPTLRTAPRPTNMKQHQGIKHRLTGGRVPTLGTLTSASLLLKGGGADIKISRLWNMTYTNKALVTTPRVKSRTILYLYNH